MPKGKSSVLFVLSLRELYENQDLISSEQLEKELGGRVEVGLVDR